MPPFKLTNVLWEEKRRPHSSGPVGPEEVRRYQGRRGTVAPGNERSLGGERGPYSCGPFGPVNRATIPREERYRRSE